jgi:hypothetical protein
LQDFHPADFENPAAKYVEKWFNFVVEIKEVIVPNLGLAALRTIITHS